MTVLSLMSSTRVIRYPGVYQLRPSNSVTGVLTNFYRNFLDACVCNATRLHRDDPHLKCPLGLTLLHEAVDPALVFDYSTNHWTVNASRVASDPTMLWSESNWPSVMFARGFRRETPTAQNVILAGGVMWLLSSLVAVYLLHTRWCSRTFRVV
jgi:hypothetical protein